MLSFPENCATPIAGDLAMVGATGYPVSMELDWRQEGPQTWDITVETEDGTLALSLGGAALAIDGQEVSRAPEREYPELYRRFAVLLAARGSDVDAAPLRICADAFLLGERRFVAPFHD